MVWFFRIVTELGNIWAVFAVGILVLCFFGFREGFRFGFVVGVACVIGFVLKEIFKSPRPDTENALTHTVGYSFPSLHAITAVVLALYIFFAFIRYSRFTLPLKIGAAYDLIIAAVLVGWSRIYLGVHFWEDVLAGAVLGVMFYFALTWLFDKVCKVRLSRECKTLRSTKQLARAFAAFLRKRKAAIVLFYAPMGAGKTTFTRDVVKWLGTPVLAASPTFSIINKYCENIFHVDLYRIESIAELQNTDFYEIIAGNNFVFVEWAEKFDADTDERNKEFRTLDYPAGAIKVEIDVKEDGSRVFNFTY